MGHIIDDDVGGLEESHLLTPSEIMEWEKEQEEMKKSKQSKKQRF